ncbi:DUF5995 family protein [Actinomadura rayongensis]|uniref:Uncharacterized protein n=1 Tax=Actinomadura rayongensis TaxID=1429076 RepID=A0A6I4W4P3_9ACTN|nr:DUF5995 family protein [Actinomadura rayongensis]MXQ65157.1 hypothetical protein [Actinomadura rayongensis]
MHTTVVQTVDPVLDRMRAIGRGLGPHDGVGRFNRVYLRVTELVAADLSAGAFHDPDFVARLDRVFAGLYFDAVAADEAGRAPGHAWRPLFEARGARAVCPLQHVLAGMNAHISHDLPLAVIETCAERGLTPGPAVHADYLRVNDLLARAEAEARREVEPWLLRLATRDLETVKHIIGTFGVARARDLAWCAVEALWPQRGTPLFDASADLLARTVETTGRLLVTPVVPPVFADEPSR